MTTVAYIRWIDAHGGSEQYSLAQAIASRPDKMESAGVLVAEGDDYITIVQDLFGNGDDYTKPQVRHYETIPKVDILDIQRWEIGASDEKTKVRTGPDNEKS